MSNIAVSQALSPEHYPEQGGDEELEYEEEEYYTVHISETYSMPYGQSRGEFKTLEEAEEYAREYNDNMEERYQNSNGLDMLFEYSTASVSGPYKRKKEK